MTVSQNAPMLGCDGCRTTLDRMGCPTHRDQPQPAPGANLYITHCMVWQAHPHPPKHDGDTVDPAAVAAWLSEDDRLAEAMVGVWEGGPDRDQPVDVWLYGWAAAIIHALREQGAVRSTR